MQLARECEPFVECAPAAAKALACPKCGMFGCKHLEETAAPDMRVVCPICRRHNALCICRSRVRNEELREEDELPVPTFRRIQLTREEIEARVRRMHTLYLERHPEGQAALIREWFTS